MLDVKMRVVMRDGACEAHCRSAKIVLLGTYYLSNSKPYKMMFSVLTYYKMITLVLWMVAAVSVAFQSGESRLRWPSSKRMAIKGVADEEALFSASVFPIAPEALIGLAHDVLDKGIGIKDHGNCLDDSFEFVAAYVGPLGKETYLAAIANFKIEDAFDLESNYHLFRVDPFQPNRVWFHTRTSATHTGAFLGKGATGKKLELPPQCMHMDFTDEGKVKEFGFYVIDRRQGNTGGPLPAPPLFFCRLTSFVRFACITDAT